MSNIQDVYYLPRRVDFSFDELSFEDVTLEDVMGLVKQYPLGRIEYYDLIAGKVVLYDGVAEMLHGI